MSVDAERTVVVRRCELDARTDVDGARHIDVDAIASGQHRALPIVLAVGINGVPTERHIAARQCERAAVTEIRDRCVVDRDIAVGVDLHRAVCLEIAGDLGGARRVDDGGEVVVARARITLDVTDIR